MCLCIRRKPGSSDMSVVPLAEDQCRRAQAEQDERSAFPAACRTAACSRDKVANGIDTPAMLGHAESPFARRHSIHERLPQRVRHASVQSSARQQAYT